MQDTAWGKKNLREEPEVSIKLKKKASVPQWDSALVLPIDLPT